MIEEKLGQSSAALAYNFRVEIPPINSDEIVLCFSPYNGFMLSGHDFGCPAVLVHERQVRYFVRRMDSLIESCRLIINHFESRKIKLIGSSKSGYAALFIGRTLASEMPERLFRCLTFSPVTTVYPVNPIHNFKTYRWFLDAVKIDDCLRREAERFGQMVTAPTNTDNYHETIVFGSKVAADLRAVEQLEATTNVAMHTQVPLPTGIHHTITMVANAANDFEIFIQKCISQGTRPDAELQTPWLTNDNEKFTSEAQGVYSSLAGRDLNHFIASLFP